MTSDDIVKQRHKNQQKDVMFKFESGQEEQRSSLSLAEDWQVGNDGQSKPLVHSITSSAYRKCSLAQVG